MQLRALARATGIIALGFLPLALAACGRTPTEPPPCVEANATRVDTLVVEVYRPDGTVWSAPTFIYRCDGRVRR